MYILNNDVLAWYLSNGLVNSNKSRMLISLNKKRLCFKQIGRVKFPRRVKSVYRPSLDPLWLAVSPPLAPEEAGGEIFSGVGHGVHWDQDLPETESYLQEEEGRGEEHEEIGG